MGDIINNHLTNIVSSQQSSSSHLLLVTTAHASELRLIIRIRRGGLAPSTSYTRPRPGTYSARTIRPEKYILTQLNGLYFLDYVRHNQKGIFDVYNQAAGMEFGFLAPPRVFIDFRDSGGTRDKRGMHNIGGIKRPVMEGGWYGRNRAVTFLAHPICTGGGRWGITGSSRTDRGMCGRK